MFSVLECKRWILYSFGVVAIEVEVLLDVCGFVVDIGMVWPFSYLCRDSAVVGRHIPKRRMPHNKKALSIHFFNS